MSSFAKRWGFLAALVPLTGGCATVVDAVGSSVLVAVVDKAVSGHAGKECRIASLITTGTMCRVPVGAVGETGAPAEPEPVYCFGTLGEVDCYRDPDPYAPAAAPPADDLAVHQGNSAALAGVTTPAAAR